MARASLRLLVLAVAVVALVFLAGLQAEPAAASHNCVDSGPSVGTDTSNYRCGPDSFTIDMEEDSAPANTPSGQPVGHTETLGSVQTCVRIVENGVLDADEDAVDKVFFDVTGRNIPTNPPSPHNPTGMIGFEFYILYDALNLTISDRDWNFHLGANPSSNLANYSDTIPDDNDYSWRGAVADFNIADPEEGSGVLMRLGLETEATAVAGTYPIRLQANNASAYTIDPDNEPHLPDALRNGAVAVNLPATACVDDDSDGAVNSLDLCPGTAPGASVDENGCPIDNDGDGICNPGILFHQSCAESDNCPVNANPLQENTDRDAQGDACDPDDDNDGVSDDGDTCPIISGPAGNNGCPPAGPPAVGGFAGLIAQESEAPRTGAGSGGMPIAMFALAGVAAAACGGGLWVARARRE